MYICIMPTTPQLLPSTLYCKYLYMYSYVLYCTLKTIHNSVTAQSVEPPSNKSTSDMG